MEKLSFEEFSSLFIQFHGETNEKIIRLFYKEYLRRYEKKKKHI